MMPDQIFMLANGLAVFAWLLLAIWPHRRSVTDVVAGRIVPGLFAVAYVAILLTMFPRAEGSFSTLAGVRTLFGNPWLLLAGWLHYLAFDLLIGAWEARDSTERRASRWLLVPCLFLTFMFGPLGWLGYVAVSASSRRLDEPPAWRAA
jgi:hypothetical protein